MGRGFDNGPGYRGSIPGRHIKDSKMVLDTSLLSIQHCKVHIKGKVEQSGVVAIEKGAFGSPSTTVANFTHLLTVSYLSSGLLQCIYVSIYVTGNEHNKWMIDEGIMTLFFIRIYFSLYFTKGVVAGLCVREIDGGRQRHMEDLKVLDTAILTLIFFSGPYLAVLSSGSYNLASSASRPGSPGGQSPKLTISKPKAPDWRLTSARLLVSAVGHVSQHPRILGSPRELLTPAVRCFFVYIGASCNCWNIWHLLRVNMQHVCMYVSIYLSSSLLLSIYLSIYFVLIFFFWYSEKYFGLRSVTVTCRLVSKVKYFYSLSHSSVVQSTESEGKWSLKTNVACLPIQTTQSTWVILRLQGI